MELYLVYHLLMKRIFLLYVFGRFFGLEKNVFYKF